MFLAFVNVAASDLHTLQAALLLPPECLGEVRRRAISRTPIPALSRCVEISLIRHRRRRSLYFAFRKKAFILHSRQGLVMVDLLDNFLNPLKVSLLWQAIS